VDKKGRLVPRTTALAILDRNFVLKDEDFKDGAIVLNPVASNSLEYWGPKGRLMMLRWSSCKQLGIWTLPGAPFICFEPWHGYPSPGDFAGELSEKPGGFQLQPGHSKTFRIAVTF
jgi:galactose mutarotase-like enzyme